MMKQNSNSKKGSKTITLFDYALTNINKPSEKPIPPLTQK